MNRTSAMLTAVVSVLLAVVLIAGCGGDSTTTTTAAAGGGAADGAAVFAEVCAGCHGADGTGASGPDLTSRSSLTRDGVIDQVTNGGTAMPPYGDKISAEEIEAVADYVLSDIVK